MVGILTDPIQTNEGVAAEGLDAIPATPGEALGATAAEALHMLPSALLGRTVDRLAAEAPAPAGPGARLGYLPSLRGIQAPDLMTPRDANDKYGIGDVLKFDTAVPESVAAELNAAKRAELARADTIRRAGGGLLLGAAELGTGLAVNLLDPLNLAASLVPAVGPARYAAWLARAGESLGARAAVRAGVGALQGAAGTALIEGAVLPMARSEQADYTMADALLNVALGGIIGGGLHVVGGALADRFTARGDVGRALEAAPIETRDAALRGAVAQLADGGQVQGIDQVLRSEAATPAGAPAAAALGAAAQSDNLSGVIHEFRPAELQIDAKRFQFKEGADALGVTERLAGVTRWDPTKAGLVLVYEDKGGARWIVDGHQRVALANRIAAADPAQDPRLYGIVLRARDGVLPEEARAIAAAKNIAEGTGTAIDAAKILRDHPALAGDLPPRSELVRQARALTSLFNEPFRAVVNGLVPTHYAAIVGRLAPDHELTQLALIDLLARTAPENAVQAEAIVHQGLAAGTVVEKQLGLFGEEAIAKSLYVERAKVLDRAFKELRKDKAIFGAITRGKAQLEAAGNVLAAETNLQRIENDAQALQLIQTLANRAGPLSDALSLAARTAHERGQYAGPVREFVAAIRSAVEAGDFARLSIGGEGGALRPAAEGAGGAGAGSGDVGRGSVSQAATSEGTPAAASSAGEAAGKGSTSDTATSTGTQAPSRQASTAAPPEGVFSRRTSEPSSERIANRSTDLTGAIDASQKRYHAINDMGEIQARARAAAADFERMLAWAAEDGGGAEVAGVRLKDEAGIKTKLALGKTPQNIGDVLGGRIVVDDWAALAEVERRLQKAAAIVARDDKLAAPTALGYRSLHLQLAADTGISAEVQITPREIAAAQKAAHPLYAEFRRRELTAAELPKAEAAAAEQQRLYDQAWNEWSARAGERPTVPATMDPHAESGVSGSRQAEPGVAGSSETAAIARDRALADFAPGEPTDAETAALAERAVKLEEGKTPEQRLEEATAAADAELAQLEARGLLDPAQLNDQPELQLALEGERRADALSRAYEAGAACMGGG